MPRISDFGTLRVVEIAARKESISFGSLLKTLAATPCSSIVCSTANAGAHGELLVVARRRPPSLVVVPPYPSPSLPALHSESIPSKDACGEGSKICDESDYGTATLLGKSAFTPSGKVCQVMCSVANTATSNKAALKAKIDVVEAIKVPLEAANIAGISVLLNYLVLGKIDACDAGLGKDDGASLTLSFAVLFILAVTSALSY